MISGRDTLREIDQHIRSANSELERASGRIETLNHELTSIRAENAELFRQLARYRLDDLKADRLVGSLDDIDRTAVALLEKQREMKTSLNDRIDAGHKRQRALEEQRAALQDQRDAAGVALDERLEEVRSRIAQTEVYRQQKERGKEAAEVARRADDKATQSEQDRAEKGRPYEKDRLFMYLWKRRYLTPDYRANHLVRRLDAWVARLIDFQKTRPNYHMLLELPVRLREHATKTAEAADVELQALERMEREAAEADGVPGLQERLDQIEEQLQALDEEIETEEDRNRELLKERERLDSGDDSYSKQAFDLIRSELQGEELSELYRQARSTPRAEDDALVAQIGQLKDRVGGIEADLRAATQAEARSRKALGELEELRRRFRQNSYDAYDSTFPTNFPLPVLLGQVLGGLLDSGGAWREIGKNHRRSSGGGFGGFGGSSRRGGGGRRSGGFGGGRFRTGGGF
jgi:chromosome segregation ATPase